MTQEATDLEPLRQLVSYSEATVAANASPALATADIVLSWSFTTQSVGDVLSAARGSGWTHRQRRRDRIDRIYFGGGAWQDPLGLANIYHGTIDVPYYLTASTGVNDPTALGSFWKGAGGSFLTQYNPTPVATTTVTIPLLITTPFRQQRTLAGGHIPARHNLRSHRDARHRRCDGAGGLCSRRHRHADARR